MARLRLAVLLLVLAGTIAAAAPAAAQFNPFEAIFGPFRPPRDVPGRGPPPDRLPPGPPPSQQYPPQYPQQYPPSARLPPGPPPGIQSQPLPPPPGAAGPAGQPQGARPAAPRPPGSPIPPPPNETNLAALPKVANPTAVFSGLDKITGRIITFEVAVNETVQFGALQVTPRVCFTRPPTEAPNTDAFLEVDEVTLQGEVKRVFDGWMFAASPGLHAVEHPIYDVWLIDCKGGNTVTAETAPDAGQQPPPPPAQRPAQQQQPRQQQRPRQPPPPPPPDAPPPPGAVIR